MLKDRTDFFHKLDEIGSIANNGCLLSLDFKSLYLSFPNEDGKKKNLFEKEFQQKNVLTKTPVLPQKQKK